MVINHLKTWVPYWCQTFSEEASLNHHSVVSHEKDHPHIETHSTDSSGPVEVSHVEPHDAHLHYNENTG